jgi:hypothetical protein
MPEVVGSGGRQAQLRRAGLRPGWTTGACATAATTAAYTALLTGEFPDPVTITLPKGQTPSFALTHEELGDGWAMVGIVKDAGDDPDVTHLALVRSTVRHGAPGSGVTFSAGPGVGTVTLPGLPLQVGEPAINPVPRQLMRRTPWPTGRRGHRDLRRPWRGAGRQDLEQAPRHRGGPVDPGHDRRRGSLLLLGVDRQHSQRY